MNATYQIYNCQTKEIASRVYKTRRTAEREVNRRNAAYGGYLWHVVNKISERKES